MLQLEFEVYKGNKILGKSAIFLVRIPGGHQQEIYNICLKSVHAYAKKYGIDLFIIEKKEINFIHSKLEKFQFLKIFSKGYERVLVMDSDILITPNALNIFDVYNNTSIMYALEENFSKDKKLNRDPLICQILKGLREKIEWPKNNKNKYRFFNSGVMIIGNKFHSIFENIKSVPQISGMFDPFKDNTVINYLIVKNKIPFKPLDYSWNRMDFFIRDPTNERYKANFIHYAGLGYASPGNKLALVKKDFEALYK